MLAGPSNLKGYFPSIPVKFPDKNIVQFPLCMINLKRMEGKIRCEANNHYCHLYAVGPVNKILISYWFPVGAIKGRKLQEKQIYSDEINEHNYLTYPFLNVYFS